LTATGRQFLVNGSPLQSTTQTWTQELLDEYTYGEAKFVRQATHGCREYSPYYYLVTNAIDENGNALDGLNRGNMTVGSNNVVISTTSQNLWFRVEPLFWFITNWSSLLKRINPSSYGSDTAMNLLAVDVILAGIPFHSENVTQYYNSGIRAWLNGTSSANASPAPSPTSPAVTIPTGKSFLETAFTTAQQGIIESKALENNTDYTKYTDSSDQDTNDKIYLLSCNEFGAAGGKSSYDPVFQAFPTDFALANYANYYSYAGQYWLRSAYSSSELYRMETSLSSYKTYPYYAFIGPRPALRITPEKGNIITAHIQMDE
jgi:hypothetical protein